MTDAPELIPTGGRGMARNTLWNLVGMCTPILIALIAIPFLIRGLGESQFGLLSLVWMLVGYFTLLDMGMGLALTRLVSERIGKGLQEEVPTLFWTACVAMFALGLLGLVVLFSGAQWLAYTGLRIPPEFRHEAFLSFRMVAFCLPLVVMTAGMIGMLESHQRFALINMVRIPIGSFTFVGPLLVLPFSTRLSHVVLVLLAGRVAEFAIYFVSCLKVVPALRRRIRCSLAEVRPLITTGGWITVSNLLIPLMLSLDRFIIGSLLSVRDVAYYATPAEIVVKLLIFPRAWVSVLFPSFAAHFHRRKEETSALFRQSLYWLMAFLWPIVLGIAILAPEGLNLWLGPDFAVQSAPVLRWLICGIFLLCLSWIPFSFLQGIGKPDWAAKVHMVEFPVFLALSVLLTKRIGITGAAMAWVVRAALDLVIMLALARKQAQINRSFARQFVLLCAVALLVTVISVLPQALLARIIVGAALFVVCAAVFWFRILVADERAMLKDTIRSFLVLLRGKRGGA